MNAPSSLRKTVVILVAVILIGATASLAPPARAAGTTAPIRVLVTNGRTGPVPVTVRGTPAVTVANTAEVKVMNAPNVQVTNIPTVNVGSAPPVDIASIPPVQVSSSPSSPVTTSEHTGKEPTSWQMVVALPDGTSYGTFGPTRIDSWTQVQNVAVFARMPTGQKPINAQIMFPSGQVYAPLVFTGNVAGAWDCYCATIPCNILVAPGSDVTMVVTRYPASSTAQVDATISGYRMPSAP
jgi:uncharacterized protein (DUF302 family)